MLGKEKPSWYLFIHFIPFYEGRKAFPFQAD